MTFQILMIVWQTYGSMECKYVCIYACMYICMDGCKLVLYTYIYMYVDTHPTR